MKKANVTKSKLPSRSSFEKYSKDKLIDIILEQQAQIALLLQEVSLLKTEVKSLKRHLIRYENPHTPSSKQQDTQKKKTTKKDKEQKKKPPGGVVGHTGATRPIAKPDTTEQATAENCPKCQSASFEILRIEEKIIEEFIPAKIKVTRFLVPHYLCQCGHCFQGVHEELPQKGRLGVKIMVAVNALKYQLRGVHRKIQGYLNDLHNFHITHRTVANLLSRSAVICEEAYWQLLAKLRGSPFIYMDETSIRVLGKKYWLWVFRTAETIFVAIRPSRGRDVIESLFGKIPELAGVCDGWQPYKIFKHIQRCWAHLLRIVDDAAKASEIAKEFATEIHECFQLLKQALEKEFTDAQLWAQRHFFDDHLFSILERYKDVKELKSAIGYISNAKESWFTCLVYQGMQPTNNLAEQAIREHVIVKRIIGTFRSESGSQEYQYVASLLATWKLQNKNMFEELENLIRRELCLKLT